MSHTPPTAETLIAQLAEAVAQVADPTERALLAGALLAAAPDLQADLAELRHQAVREIQEGGASLATIGKALGVSKTRAAQLAAGVTTKGRAASE